MITKQQHHGHVWQYDTTWLSTLSYKEFESPPADATPADAGRGAAWFFRLQELDVVWRHCRRGGLIGKLNPDRYLRLMGVKHARPFREFALLNDLFIRGFPVPRPLAAHVAYHGIWYTGDLWTQRIADVTPLSALNPDDVDWAQLGRCIARFHRHGVQHGDLNAHNILRNTEKQWFVIDFDKSRVRSDQRFVPTVLNRFARSLKKLHLYQTSCYRSFLKAHDAALKER